MKRMTSVTGLLLIAVLLSSAFTTAGSKAKPKAKINAPKKVECTITISVSEVISYTCTNDPNYTFTATVVGTGTATSATSCDDATRAATQLAKIDMAQKAMVEYGVLAQQCTDLP